MIKQQYFKKQLPAANKLLSKRKGFTLVEILLAMLITSILVLGMNAMFRQAKLIYRRTEDKRPMYQKARILTELLRNELSCLYFPPKAETIPYSLSLTSKADTETELAFFTLTPSFKTSPQACRIAKVRYVFGEDENTGRTVLQRFEQPYSGEKDLGEEHSDIVAKDLSEFKMLALEDNENVQPESWKSSYTSKEVPPKALKVSLEWHPGTNCPPVAFNTTFVILCQEPLTLSEQPYEETTKAQVD